MQGVGLPAHPGARQGSRGEASTQAEIPVPSAAKVVMVKSTHRVGGFALTRVLKVGRVDKAGISPGGTGNGEGGAKWLKGNILAPV